MRDLGLVTIDEPVTRLFPQGMVHKDGEVMSKSKGNTIAPDDVIKRYGADTLRLYILFAGPPELAMDWSESGIEGPHRFLQQVWRLFDRHAAAFAKEKRQALPAELPAAASELRRKVHQTIQRVTHDIEERIQLNTAVAALMELKNEIQRLEAEVAAGPGREVLREALETLVKLLNPFTPHISEELWARLGHATSLVREAWPAFDAAAAREDEVELAVQVNGKVRGRITVAREAREDEIRARALAEPRVAEQVNGKEIVKFVVVPLPARQPGGPVRRRHVLTAAASALAAGCGYSLQGRGITTDASVKRIGVPLFKDRTGKVGLDTHVTQAVMVELLKRGRFTVVRDAAGRRRRGRGRDPELQRGPGGFSSDTGLTQATRYAISLTASRRLPQDRAGRADLVARRLLAARRVRHERELAELLRPRGAVDRAPVDGVRAQPRGRHAGGVLAPGWRQPPGRPAPIQAIVGEDSYLAEAALERVLQAAAPGERTSRCACSTATRRSGRTCCQAARAGSLFAASRAVVVRRAELLKYGSIPKDDESPGLRRRGKGKNDRRTRSTPTWQRRRRTRRSC